jgi:hypothetical protein
MEILKTIGWGLPLVLVVLVLGWILYSRRKNFTNRVDYSVDGKKGSLGFIKPELWQKHWDKVFALLVVAAVVVFVAGCSNGTDTPTPPAVAVVNCQGSYVGSYGPPDHDERIRLRNLSLGNRGIAVTGNDDIDNANAGGGAPDGGIWMGGSYSFETDANCNVTKGKTLIFYAYEYDIGGTVGKDGTFNLTWSGQGSAGEMHGKVDTTGNITGQFFHPAPDSFVYGMLNGTYTPGAAK